MYRAYYLNIQTGEIRTVGTPREGRDLMDKYGWNQITADEYHRLKLVATYYAVATAPKG